jgi:hypothetical protein
MTQRFNTIESVIADIQSGKIVILVDDADRENEGDLIMAAQSVTPEAINFMAKHGRGLICVPTTSERLQQLGIERMVRQNRETFKTDFQVRRIGLKRSVSWPIRRPARKRWFNLAMSFLCGRVPAVSCNAPVTLKRLLILRNSPGDVQSQ